MQLALGASRSRVYVGVFTHGIRPIAIGLFGGILIAIAFGHLLESRLFGIRPLDPATITGGVLTWLLAGILGSFVPARRPARIDPIAAIRLE